MARLKVFYPKYVLEDCENALPDCFTQPLTRRLNHSQDKEFVRYVFKGSMTSLNEL